MTDQLLTLLNVVGLPQRVNSLLVALGKDIELSEVTKNDILKRIPVVIYFGGDVQNTRVEMNGRYDGYLKDLYSYESIMEHLRERFSRSQIILVSPAEHVNAYAHYSNFVQIADEYGSPKYSYDNTESLIHLVNLLRNGQKEFASKLNQVMPKSDQKLTLIGFSKGCTVLNQLMIARSIDLVQNCDSLNGFQLEELIFLDSGHCGDTGAYITDPKHLTGFGKEPPLTPLVSISASKYELQKTWINNELPKFISRIKNFGVEVQQKIFEGGNLRDHFGVHNALWNGQVGHIDDSQLMTD